MINRTKKNSRHRETETARPGLLLLYALLLFSPLARGSVQDWAVTVIHLLTVAAAAVFFLRAALGKRLEWVPTPVDLPAFLLLLIVAASTAFSVTPRLSLQSALLLLNYLLVFYWTVQAVRSRTHLRQLLWVICMIGFLLTIIGFLKLFGNNPFPWWNYTDLEPTPWFTSTFGNRNHLAGFMEMAIPLALGICLSGVRGWKFGFAVYFVLALSTALVLSLSRGGWLGAFIGLLFMAVCLLLDRRFKRKAILLTIVGGSFVVILVVLSSTSTVERILTVSDFKGGSAIGSRLVVWGGVLDMIEQNPILGAGPGTFPYVFTRFQPPGFAHHFKMAHNDYLQFAAEAGLPVLGIMGWAAFLLYRKGFQKLQDSSRLIRGTTLGALSGITAILVHSFFDFNLQIPANTLLFTVLCAVVAAPKPSMHSELDERPT
jgi:O-antigen ligase